MSLSKVQFATLPGIKMAVDSALSVIIPTDSALHNLVSCHQCHIVVLVSENERTQASNYPDWFESDRRASLVFEHRVGFAGEQTDTWVDIAHSEALTLWNSEAHASVGEHLLFPGRELSWGAFCDTDLMVVCSGLQPFNSMISGVIANFIFGFAREESARAKQ